MCRFALVLLLGTLGVYAGRIPRFPRTLPGRIIDGEMAEEGQFPWQASLQSGGSHYCGASILSENFILTAAHCIFLPTTDYTVSVGMNQLSDPNRQTARVASHRQHPDYDEYEIINDYAVIELAAPLDLDGVKAAALQIGEGIPREGQVCRVSGWGVTDPYGNTPDDLMYVDLNHMSNENCKARWSVFDVTIDEDRHICFIDPSDTEGSPCFAQDGYHPCSRIRQQRSHVAGSTSHVEVANHKDIQQ
ncbi:unnamed protein product [Cyprideis torosa]|uniref:Uncharacterized protein n=1 Tax=Cyprideis torosa TaxID=163714 RepID=A0A7R8ZHR2_9CRUS|nr:unnamed protein product [Cyprideis torosa]CAG0883076.1 unnamed protein product [Cyprideis torosa]